MMQKSADQAVPDAALFIDWDNLKVGLKELGRQPNISSLLDTVGHRGRVVIARAYADWQQRSNAFDPPNLYAAGIEPVYVPVRMQSGKALKNSADVKLAVDCIDFLNTAPHLKVFFLVSGDSDLVHLVNFLRARGKRVVGIAVSHTLSATLAENLDELLLYDVDIEPIRQPEVSSNGRKPRPTVPSAQDDSPQDEEAFNVLTDLLRNRSNRIGSLFSWIGIQLGRKGVDHRAIGFERFKDFMQEAERRGYIRILTRGLQDWAYLPEQYEQMTETELAAEEEDINDGDEDIHGTVAVSALDEDAQRNFLRFLMDLEQRSEYLIPPYIVSHLVRESVLPSLSQSQLRSLVRDAMSEQLLVPSTHTVPHRSTGKPYDLRTVRMNQDHPLVRALTETVEA
ncbi:MAG TPA: NYN domain-containing protein [Chloroflexota bacterium]